MLKLLRTIKNDNSSSTKDDLSFQISLEEKSTPSQPVKSTGWSQFSSKLLGRLSTATQADMPQMPSPAPSTESPRKRN